MKTISKKLLFWVPRLLTIAFALFISIFALDVFGEHLGFWHTVLALLLHLIPTFLILVLLALAWRWAWVGGAGYFALGSLYLYMFAGRFPWSVYVVIAGPAFLIGMLFFANWIWRSELQAATRS